MKPKVTVLILNWNGLNNTIKCLESLKNVAYPNYELIIVDNGSTDGSADYFQKHYPMIKLILNSQNLGYAGGNNVGISYAIDKGTDYILLLNNDTIVDPNFLTELILIAENDAKIKVVQSKIVSFEGNIEHHTCCDKYGATLSKIENDDNTIASKNESLQFYPSGACMLIKRTVLTKNFFDDKLFAYFEDVDTGWQFRLKGYKIGYAPKSICYHEDNSSLKNNIPFIMYLVWKNRIRVLIKNYSFYNLMKRLPVALAFEFFSSLYFALGRRNMNYVNMYMKSVYWNIVNMEDTFNQRKLVQSSRVISDDQIESLMINGSLEANFMLKYFKKYI